MSDDAPLAPPAKPTPRQPNAAGELLFEFVRSDRVRVRFELCDHGRLGTDVHIFHNEEFFGGYRHESRELAIVWAVQERKSQESSGGGLIANADEAERETG